MSKVYNTILRVANGVITLTKACPILTPGSRKVRQFAAGQRNWRHNMADNLPDAAGRPTIWLHGASYGEFAILRPIIKQLGATGKYRIVVTFFSATGVNAMRNKASEFPEIDYVGYLPLDTPGNVRDFLDIVQPAKAIFAVSEYWVNYLTELKHRNIPTYLLSALITRRAPFFRWYGRMYRNVLDAYTNIMVLTTKSKDLLEKAGYSRAVLSGDPLFDNAMAVASTPWRNEIVERFIAGRPVFMAGSISDWKDVELCSCVANKQRAGLKYIFVPHEVEATAIKSITTLQGKYKLYSECDNDTDFTDVQVLVYDKMGDLASLYRYATYAYIGGGFTSKLHSIIEATVYGVPTAFGPEIHRKATPLELQDRGIGTVVADVHQINRWIEGLIAHPESLPEIKQRSLEYAQMNAGATDKIIRQLDL